MNLRNMKCDLKKTCDDQFLTTDPVRNEYIKWLQSIDCKYHLTITFGYGLSESKSRELLDRLIHYLNLRIYRKRYSQSRQEFLEGVAVMEDSKGMDTVHFHILFKDQPHLPAADEFRGKVAKEIEACNRHSDSRIQHFELQETYLSPYTSLEAYLTKVFEQASYDKKPGDRFGLLGPDGVSFGERTITSMGMHSHGAFRNYSAR
ncbi:hypothetical protein NCG89_08195 [Spongiibacter taiwanensis]|uniref:hypothetical protein n=1 Tax=Spongiibacter taiwanensis TaxID=1748242 RepID=UPI0020353080|nr:hypothetical protein [Spongiibacter taiwanensis]USA44733.1 hypothetical protein NCG89_08195 [Spongiibacter taiwanensis]